MNNYAKGANKERLRVKWHLEQGAVTAHRSAGSHSPVDITAVYADGVVLESLKCGSASISPEEAEALIEIRLGAPPSVRVHYVQWPDYEPPKVTEVTVYGFPGTRGTRRRGKGNAGLNTAPPPACRAGTRAQ